MRIENQDLIKIGAIAVTDLTQSFNSQAFLIEHIYGYSVQVSFSGVFAGTFKIQTSNDVGTAPTHWNDLANSSAAVVAGAYGGEAGIMWNVERSFYRWFRIVYTPTSGTGTLTSATMTIKGV
jgi:hypothetical protein